MNHAVRHHRNPTCVRQPGNICLQNLLFSLKFPLTFKTESPSLFLENTSFLDLKIASVKMHVHPEGCDRDAGAKDAGHMGDQDISQAVSGTAPPPAPGANHLPAYRQLCDCCLLLGS